MFLYNAMCDMKRIL